VGWIALLAPNSSRVWPHIYVAQPVFLNENLATEP